MQTDRQSLLKGGALPTLRAGGPVLLGLLMALYYATVIVSGLHFTVLQVISLWGIALMFMPSSWRLLTRADTAVLLAVTAMFVVALISYAVNDLWDHPEGNLSRYVRLLFFVPIYFVARRFGTARAFWLSLLVGTLITGLWAVLEFLKIVRHPDDIWREVSGAVNSIQFGDLSLALAAMTCAGMPVYRKYGRGYLIAAVPAAAAAFFGCLASNTRGAWIAVPALGVLLAWSYVRNGLLTLRQLLLLFAAGVAMLAVVVPRTDVIPQIMEAVHEVRTYEKGSSAVSNAGYRFELWRVSWELFKDNPVVGVGPGLYRARALEVAGRAGGYNSEAMKFSQPASEYFFVMATLGTLGLLASALLWFVPLARFVRAFFAGDIERQALGTCGGVLVAGYLHFGLTEGLLFQHATFLGFYLLSTAMLYMLLGAPGRGVAPGRSQ